MSKKKRIDAAINESLRSEWLHGEARKREPGFALQACLRAAVAATAEEHRIVCKNDDCEVDLCGKCGHCLTCHDEDPVDPCASAKKNHENHS